MQQDGCTYGSHATATDMDNSCETKQKITEQNKFHTQTSMPRTATIGVHVVMIPKQQQNIE
jgi:hypothetical protein